MTVIDDRIEQKSRRIAEVEGELRLLQAELLGLRTEVAALRGGRQPEDWRPDRTERILAILRQAEGPMSAVQITGVLSAAEPDVSAATVRATLSYLKRQGKVVSPGRGQWATGG